VNSKVTSGQVAQRGRVCVCVLCVEGRDEFFFLKNFLTVSGFLDLFLTSYTIVLTN